MRMHVMAVLLLACACKESGNRAAERLKELETKHEQDKAKKVNEDVKPVAPTISLPAPFGDADSLPLVIDGACPEGLWAFFGDAAPGNTPEEKKDNNAKRSQLLADLKSKQFLVKLRVPLVNLGAYDPPSGKFTVTVPGTIDCVDEVGHVAIAWTEAKAGAGTPSAAKEGAELTQNVWTAAPITFPLAMNMADAKTFAQKNGLGLSARVVVKFVGAAVDVKKIKMAKVQEKAQGQTIGFGGGFEDWGAGRLIRAQIVGVRVASDQEKNQLFEQKP